MAGTSGVDVRERDHTSDMQCTDSNDPTRQLRIFRIGNPDVAGSCTHQDELGMDNVVKVTIGKMDPIGFKRLGTIQLKQFFSVHDDTSRQAL